MCKSEKVKFMRKIAPLHGKIKTIPMLLKHNQDGKVLNTNLINIWKNWFQNVVLTNSPSL